MKAHAMSHAVGAFCSMIGAIGLSAMGQQYLPKLYALFVGFAGKLAEQLNDILAIELTDIIMGNTILTSLIMFIWGFGFYLLHKD